jgi:hypothetical protein
MSQSYEQYLFSQYRRKYREAGTSFDKRAGVLLTASIILSRSEFKRLLKTLGIDTQTAKFYMTLARSHNAERAAKQIKAREKARLKRERDDWFDMYPPEGFIARMDWPEREQKGWFKYERVMRKTTRNDNGHEVELAFRKATEILARIKKRPNDMPRVIRSRLKHMDITYDAIMRTDPE